MKLHRAFIALGSLAIAAAPSFAIVVTPTGDATALVNTLLSSGITLVGTPTLTGGNLNNGNSSAGAFTNGLTTGIGIDTGIVLTSGQANLVTNSNTSDGHTGSFGGAGDSQLNALVSPFTTHDATVLSFDFTTSSGDLFFQFVFASEEYNEYTNSSFTDVFGFFVDGTNIALIPGTNTPIAINTVNGGNPFGTNASHPELFNNNDISSGPPPYAFSYDGFTDVFTVSAKGLGAGTHTIKLAIADTSDFVLDSGVFIKAGSFKPVDPEIPHGAPDAGASLGLVAMGLGLLAGARRFVRR